MNRQERKRIEAGLRAAAFARAEGNLMPFSDMKEQVLNQCAQRLAYAVKDNRKQNIKARLHQARRVVLATACLMIGICVYSVLSPVPTSTANDIVKDFKLWVGKTLQTNVDAPPPADAPEVQPVVRSDYSGLTELAADAGVVLLEPTSLSAGMTLNGLESSQIPDVACTAGYYYTDGKNRLTFAVEKAGSINAEILVDSVVDYDTQVGTFHVWDAGKTMYAMLVDERLGQLITITSSTIKDDAFLKILDSLREVN